MPPSSATARLGQRGGIRAGAQLRAWTWNGTAESMPLRCKRDQWYLVRVTSAPGAAVRGVVLEFIADGEPPARRCVEVAAAAPGRGLGWVQVPPRTGQVRLIQAHGCDEVLLEPCEQRGLKCHPLAATPRWSTYRPPYPLDKAIIPQGLASLTTHLEGLSVRAIEMPTSLKQLAALAQGSVCIVAPHWAQAHGWTLREMQQLAGLCWLITDLQTLAAAAADAGAAETSVDALEYPADVICARNAYADVHTRGLALQDCVPWGWVDEGGRFQARCLRQTRSWKRFAAQAGFAPLLESETADDRNSGQAFSLACSSGSGEWTATDLPWLLASQPERLLAPQLAAHLLRMHCGLPLDDDTQYWNRWDDGDVVLRDIADLEKRYPALQPVRWAGPAPGVARCGVTLRCARPATRHLLIATGRIDLLDAHDGAPAEPMIILMKHLAREQRDQTAWADRCLSDCAVTWCFEAAGALRHTMSYRAANLPPPTDVLELRATAGPWEAAPAGGLGDSSLRMQTALAARVRSWIEQKRA